jgi:hypothetical protein
MSRLLYAILVLLLLAWHAFGQQPTYTVQSKLPKYTVADKTDKKSPLCNCGVPREKNPNPPPCKCHEYEGGCWRWCNLVGGGGVQAKAEDSGVVTYEEVVMADAQGRLGLYLKPSKPGHTWYFKGYMASRPLTPRAPVGYTLPANCTSGST